MLKRIKLGLAVIAGAMAVSLPIVLTADGASTVDEFQLTLISQNTTSYTFSYPIQDGYGYLYFTKATPTSDWMLVSNTNDQTKTTVKFSKGSYDYKVAAKVEGPSGRYTITPPADTTVPTVSMTSPVNGSTVSGTITVSANASDNVGVEKVEFYRDGILFNTDTTSPYSSGFDTTTVADGAHLFNAKAYDASNNIGTSANISTTVDNVPAPPSATFTQSIVAGATLSGKVDWHTVYDLNNDGTEDDPGSVRFYLDGVLIKTELDPPFGSEPNNPAVAFWDSTTTGDGTHTFKVEAVDTNNVVVATAGPVTATVDNAIAPPPPPSGTSLFDGQATRMTSISGSTIKVGDSGWNGGSNATQSPQIWGEGGPELAQGVYCMTDSVTLVSDPTYGKIYRMNVGPGDTNPYFDQPTKPNCELTNLRSIAMGQWDWYADSFKIVGPYTLGSFNVIAQYGYPSLASPPLSISFDGTGVGIDRHVGVLKAAGDLSGPGTIITKPRFWPVSTVLDKWVEMVIGVKWEVDQPGEIFVYARVKALGETNFRLVYHDDTRPTFQKIEGQSIKTKVNDKMGLYFGTFSSPPTNTVLHKGFTRWDNQDDAIASLG